MAPPLSRERITAAALGLVEEDGLDGLSMRKVAARLGTEAMSLYRHVRDKADLLDALQDELLGRVPVPGAGPWPDEVRRVATGFRELLFAHPRVVPLLATRPATTPRGLALVEAGVGLLRAGGFDAEDAVVAFQTVFCFVIGHAVFHTAAGRTPADAAWARVEFERGLGIVIAGLRGVVNPPRS